MNRADAATMDDDRTAGDTGYGVLLFRDPAAFWSDSGDQRAVLGMEDGTLRNVASWRTDLPGNIMFWSNAPYQSMRTAGLLQHEMLREDRYPLTTLQGVLGELGMSHADISDQAVTLTRIWSRLMRLCARAFDVPAVPRARNLALAIRDSAFGAKDPQYDHATAQVILAATRQRVDIRSTGRVRASEAKFCTMRHHRQDHAATLLSSPVPAMGNWARLDLPGQDRRVDFVLDTLRDRPVVVRASMRFLGPNRVTFASLFPDGEALWLSGLELREVAPHARIEVHDAWAAGGYADNPSAALAPVVCGPDTGGDQSPMAAVRAGPLVLRGRDLIGYSAGLACEAAWTALTQPHVAHTPDATAMWLLAVDRVICMRSAIKIMELNVPVEVTGFSRGRIWIKVSTDLNDEDASNMLAMMGSQLGLIPPVLPPPTVGSRRLAIVDALRTHTTDDDAMVGSGAARLTAALAIFGKRVLLKELTR